MRRWQIGVVLGGMAAAGCTPPPATDDHTGDTDPPTDTDPILDTDPVADTDADTDVVPVGDVNPCGVRTPTLTAGTGGAAYVALTDGASLEMVAGPQGGLHFYVGVDVHNVPAQVILEHTATRVSDGVVFSAGSLSGTFRDYVSVVPTPGQTDGDCVLAGTYWGVRSIIDTGALGPADTAVPIEPVWSSLCGAEIRIDVSVRWPRCTTYDGPTCTAYEDTLLVSDSMTFIGQPDPTQGGYCTAP